jgi:hypothetical protein
VGVDDDEREHSGFVTGTIVSARYLFIIEGGSFFTLSVAYVVTYKLGASKRAY